MNGRVCEHESGCESSPFSWSTEHGNSVLCRKHYGEFLKTTKVMKVANALNELTAEQKKQLKELLQ